MLPIGIFCRQIIQNLRVFSVLEPVVLVNTQVTMQLQTLLTLCSQRLLHTQFLKDASAERTRPRPSLEGACEGLYSKAFR